MLGRRCISVLTSRSIKPYIGMASHSPHVGSQQTRFLASRPRSKQTTNAKLHGFKGFKNMAEVVGQGEHAKRISSLKIGDAVLLQWKTESFWVEVTAIDDKVISGEVGNELIHAPWKFGETILFKRHHISMIEGSEADESRLAFLRKHGV